jgi:bacterioferritin-associated ferredoxin
MIVCQCNVLSDDALAEAVADMRQSAEPVVITPGQVFKCCGAKFQCSGCMPLITSVIAESYAAVDAGDSHCSLRLPAAYSRRLNSEA